MKNNNKGFTLIEIIVTLMLVGILGVFAGTGIVAATKGFISAKNNAEISQKAKFAIDRISRELMEITNMTANKKGDAVYGISFERIDGSRKIFKSGNILYINDKEPFDNATDYTLITGVTKFLITYTIDGAQTTSIDSTTFPKLSTIKFELSLTHPNLPSGKSLDFEATVVPRNIKVIGNPPPVASPPKLDSCFIDSLSNFNKRNSLLFIFIIFIITIFYKNKNYESLIKNKKGMALISIIASIMIISILGAGIVSLTNNAQMGQFVSSGEKRAYYLAESGFRYADQTIRNSTTPEVTIENLNGKQYKFANNEGSFQIKMYPNYFKALGENTGSAKIDFKFPGTIPDNFTSTYPSSGKIHVSGNIKESYAYTSVNIDITNTKSTFTLQSPLTKIIPADTPLLSVGLMSGQQTIKKGSNLTLTNTGAFPEYNGVFQIGNELYSYDKKDATTLININNQYSKDAAFTYPNNTEVILRKNAKLISVGTFGTGYLASSNQIIYHYPIPSDLISDTSTHTQTFDSSADFSKYWFGNRTNDPLYGDKFKDRSSAGAHEIINVNDSGKINTGSNTAARVKDISLTPVAGMSVVALDWSRAINLAQAWGMKDPHSLSYDAEIKIAVDKADYTTYSQFMSGIGFRLDESGTCLGASWVKNKNGSLTGIDTDGIPDFLVPDNQDTKIVLWEANAIYDDASQAALAKRTQGSSWARLPNGGYDPSITDKSDGRYYKNYFSINESQSSLNYNVPIDQNASDFDSKEAVYALKYDVDLTNAKGANLAFMYMYDYQIGTVQVNIPVDLLIVKFTISFPMLCFDAGFFEIREKNTKNWTTLSGPYTMASSIVDYITNGFNSDKVMLELVTSSQLSGFYGKNCEIRFIMKNLNTLQSFQEYCVAEAVNNFIWPILLKLTCSSNEKYIGLWPLGDCYTKLAIQQKINELFAPLSTAIQNVWNSIGTNSRKIDDRWRVAEIKLFYGSWLASKTINNVKDGTPPPFSTIGVRVKENADSNNASNNYNDIQVYISETSKKGTPNIDSTDFNRDGVPRIDHVTKNNFYWLSEKLSPVSANEDYFTLITWDNVFTGHSKLSQPTNIADNPNGTIIRLNDHLTSGLSKFERPEIGLITYGYIKGGVKFDVPCWPWDNKCRCERNGECGKCQPGMLPCNTVKVGIGYDTDYSFDDFGLAVKIPGYKSFDFIKPIQQ